MENKKTKLLEYETPEIRVLCSDECDVIMTSSEDVLFDAADLE